MLRLLADENFSSDILRGLFLQRPDLDVARVQDVGLRGAVDPDILAWAARQGRIILTHDRATMPAYALQRVADGVEMPGVFIVGDSGHGRVPRFRAGCLPSNGSRQRLRLPVHERARLAEELISSLDDDAEIEAARRRRLHPWPRPVVAAP